MAKIPLNNPRRILIGLPMGLRHIILPKEPPRKSTIASRLGVLFYWLGAIWLFGVGIYSLLLAYNPEIWSSSVTWAQRLVGAGIITAFVGLPIFFTCRALLFVLANR